MHAWLALVPGLHSWSMMALALPSSGWPAPPLESCQSFDIDSPFDYSPKPREIHGKVAVIGSGTAGEVGPVPAPSPSVIPGASAEDCTCVPDDPCASCLEKTPSYNHDWGAYDMLGLPPETVWWCDDSECGRDAQEYMYTLDVDDHGGTGGCLSNCDVAEEADGQALDDIPVDFLTQLYFPSASFASGDWGITGVDNVPGALLTDLTVLEEENEDFAGVDDGEEEDFGGEADGVATMVSPLDEDSIDIQTFIANLIGFLGEDAFEGVMADDTNTFQVLVAGENKQPVEYIVSFTMPAHDWYLDFDQDHVEFDGVVSDDLDATNPIETHTDDEQTNFTDTAFDLFYQTIENTIDNTDNTKIEPEQEVVDDKNITWNSNQAVSFDHTDMSTQKEMTKALALHGSLVWIMDQDQENSGALVWVADQVQTDLAPKKLDDIDAAGGERDDRQTSNNMASDNGDSDTDDISQMKELHNHVESNRNPVPFTTPITPPSLGLLDEIPTTNDHICPIKPSGADADTLMDETSMGLDLLFEPATSLCNGHCENDNKSIRRPLEDDPLLMSTSLLPYPPISNRVDADSPLENDKTSDTQQDTTGTALQLFIPAPPYELQVSIGMCDGSHWDVSGYLDAVTEGEHTVQTVSAALSHDSNSHEILPSDRVPAVILQASLACGPHQTQLSTRSSNMYSFASNSDLSRLHHDLSSAQIRIIDCGSLDEYQHCALSRHGFEQHWPWSGFIASVSHLVKAETTRDFINVTPTHKPRFYIDGNFCQETRELEQVPRMDNIASSGCILITNLHIPLDLSQSYLASYNNGIVTSITLEAIANVFYPNKDVILNIPCLDTSFGIPSIDAAAVLTIHEASAMAKIAADISTLDTDPSTLGLDAGEILFAQAKEPAALLWPDAEFDATKPIINTDTRPHPAPFPARRDISAVNHLAFASSSPLPVAPSLHSDNSDEKAAVWDPVPSPSIGSHFSPPGKHGDSTYYGDTMPAVGDGFIDTDDHFSDDSASYHGFDPNEVLCSKHNSDTGQDERFLGPRKRSSKKTKVCSESVTVQHPGLLDLPSSLVCGYVYHNTCNHVSFDSSLEQRNSKAPDLQSHTEHSPAIQLTDSLLTSLQEHIDPVPNLNPSKQTQILGSGKPVHKQWATDTRALDSVEQTAPRFTVTTRYKDEYIEMDDYINSEVKRNSWGSFTRDSAGAGMAILDTTNWLRTVEASTRHILKAMRYLAGSGPYCHDPGPSRHHKSRVVDGSPKTTRGSRPMTRSYRRTSLEPGRGGTS